jgi:FkbM family methyltransferase
MSVNYFLYRRLCRWITCDLRLPFQVNLSLSTKYDVASFQDVFCHPFYWQVFAWIQQPPRLVVDCGANCGHFTVLVDTCTRVKFGISDTRYILVEPNPALLPILRRNLADAGLAARCRVLTGLLGLKTGNSTLWVHPKNYLASSLTPMAGARPYEVPFIDLKKSIDAPAVDVLKIDIEGGEYPFVRENADVLSLCKLLMMEVHEASPAEQDALFSRVEATGLTPLGQPVAGDGLCLRAWSRQLAG